VLKALRDSEDVRTLLQLLQAIQQEAGVCLVFEKARRAIERAGSQSITLAEFEAHLVPAPQQRRKPSLPVRLLTGLSLSVVQGLSLYVIAAHAGLVSSPVSAAAARASIGTGGELSQWDTAAAQAVQAVRGAGARAVAAAATTADTGADARSWSEGGQVGMVQVGIKSDDAAAAAAAPMNGGGTPTRTLARTLTLAPTLARTLPLTPALTLTPALSLSLSLSLPLNLTRWWDGGPAQEE
jgi:hypothetical protein